MIIIKKNVFIAIWLSMIKNKLSEKLYERENEKLWDKYKNWKDVQYRQETNKFDKTDSRIDR